MSVKTKNPALQVVRENFDQGDPWGSAMAWAWGICEVLYDADPNSVAPSLEYRPSIIGSEAGPDSEDFQTETMWHLLHQTPGYWVDPTFGARVEDLQYAARVLSRYLDWCKLAGRDY